MAKTKGIPQGAGVRACTLISKRLKQLDPKRWTDYRIAKELGISQTSYTTLRDGTENPRKAMLQRLYKLAHAQLGMSIGEFWDLLS
jgi:transcriptional regulator with XRE-family HTH domain